MGNARVFWTHRKWNIEACTRHCIPSSFARGDSVIGGGLTCYASDRVETFRKSGTGLARILNGAKPTDLPIEQSTRYELIVDMRTARSLGIAIPSSLPSRGGEVMSQ